ncbi:MAG: hypothetical protein ABIS47_11670 [Acidimicrobiales bacterium]
MGGYEATVIGASAGEVIGFLLAVAAGYVSYFIFFGGSGCAGDGCDDPFGSALLVFLLTAPVLLLVGSAVGCHLALRSIGDRSRRLTVALVPVLGLAALVLLPAGAFAVGAATPVPTLFILVPTLLFIVPFAARFLATRRGGRGLSSNGAGLNG